VKQYRALVSAGLTDDDFYFTLENLLVELRDDHSQYWSPETVKANTAESSGHTQYVGIGALVTAMPEQGYGVIAYTLLGGTAAAAGLKAHDIILAVDGQPLLDRDGSIADIIRGPEGSHVTLTLRHPGGEPFDLTLERRKIDSPDPVNACLIPRTRVAYIFLPSLEDDTIPDQLRGALRTLTADGPLDGVILDNRLNGGGSYPVFTGVLSFFMDGTAGYFVNRGVQDKVTIDGEDLGGSQDVPLVVLVGQDTASFGEIMSGVLQSLGRARIVGQLTLGNVEILYPYEFDDGSLAYIAHDTFQPVGQEAGVWEKAGIVPDVEVPVRWDLFTEATDPAIAASLQIFSAQGKQVPARP
jgi:carboxyl-terminal processing protease